MKLRIICLALAGAIVCPAQSPSPPATETPDALNAAYTQAMQAKDWAGAVSAAQQLVQASPSAENIRLLANAQLNSGAFRDSVATFDRALVAANAEKPAEGQLQDDWREHTAQVYLGKGNALLKLRSDAEASRAYTQAAQLARNPGLAYFNICAVFYNKGDMPVAASACRKSVNADPGRADAWFVLGSILFADATTGDNGKFVISTEARNALEKYLALAPDGPHAADVKAMLDAAK